METKHKTIFEIEKGKRTLARRREVEKITGLSRSSIYARMDAGTFPLNVDCGGRVVAWVLSEVLSWVEARIAERDQMGAKRHRKAAAVGAAVEGRV